MLERWLGIRPRAWIAAQLGRSLQSLASREKRLSTDAWYSLGYLSVAEAAREYGCQPYRIRSLIASGQLPARRHSKTYRFRIDPTDLERLERELRRPNKTWKE